MTNLWGVLLQTCSVSLVAGLLLGLKRVWKQTLSPRWQSALWGILAVRILFPVTMTGKFLLLPLPFWVETLKTVVEGHLSSSYTSFYEMTQVTAPIPWIAGLPSSVTDWLFLLYSFGVGVMLLRYLLAYLRLRCCLRLGHPAPLEVQRTVHEIGKRYALRVCRVVVLPGLSSPLVFGVLRPVMVLPEGTVDEAMLLHELLHIKYWDALQNSVWCICRALHWCNPLVLLAIDRAELDMESLCDQRVLERLEGEARRAYGYTLLAMADGCYSCIPGTTSMADGSRNIGRRIEVIARFRRYPRGMALVVACMMVLLLGGTVLGTGSQGVRPMLSEGQTGGWEKAAALASLRLAHCSTVAGALDTYAKGMMTGEPTYLAIASPREVRREWERELSRALYQGEKMEPIEMGTDLSVYVLDRGEEGSVPIYTGQSTDISLQGNAEMYTIHNLREEPDGTMTAQLLFSLEDLDGMEPSEGSSGVLRYGVRIMPEEGWGVEGTGLRELYLGDLARENMSGVFLDVAVYPGGRTQRAEGVYGTVTRRTLTEHHILTEGEEAEGFFGNAWDSSELVPDLDAVFDKVNESSVTTCVFRRWEETDSNRVDAGLQVANRREYGGVPDFPETLLVGEGGWGTEFGSETGDYKRSVYRKDWDGILTVRGIHSYSEREYQATGFAVQLWLEGERKEMLLLKEVTEEGGV